MSRRLQAKWLYGQGRFTIAEVLLVGVEQAPAPVVQVRKRPVGLARVT
jgi:hypothetical protein